jgi:soluble lytic murein transglycosylase-like protein
MLRLIPILVLAALPAAAGEFALLTSGYRLHADRHEVSGGTVRLFENDRITELPASVITGFELEEEIPAVPPAAAPQPVAAEPKTTEIALDPKPAAAPAPPPARADTKSMLRAAAERTGLPPQFGALVQSVAKVESGMNQKAVSPKGAIGVMQLMPGTARTLGADPKVAEENIDAGARLLRDLLQKYDGDVIKALAAYNAGEAAVDRYQGIPPYWETQHYVNQVVKDYIKNGGPQEPAARGGSQ